MRPCFGGLGTVDAAPESGGLFLQAAGAKTSSGLTEHVTLDLAALQVFRISVLGTAVRLSVDGATCHEVLSMVSNLLALGVMVALMLRQIASLHAGDSRKKSEGCGWGGGGAVLQDPCEKGFSVLQFTR